MEEPTFVPSLANLSSDYNQRGFPCCETMAEYRPRCRERTRCGYHIPRSHPRSCSGDGDLAFPCSSGLRHLVSTGSPQVECWGGGGYCRISVDKGMVMPASGWATRRDAVPEPTGRHRSTGRAHEIRKRIRGAGGVADLDWHSSCTLLVPAATGRSKTECAGSSVLWWCFITEGPLGCHYGNTT